MASKRTYKRRMQRRKLQILHKTGMFHRLKLREFTSGITVHGPDDPRFAAMRRGER